MSSYPIRIHTVGNRPAASGDDALGEALVVVCHQAVERRAAPSSALVVRSDRMDVIPLQPLTEQRLRLQHFIAGLTVASMGERPPSDVHAVGLIGSFNRRRPDGVEVPVAMVFLEWTDCRWWHWHALVDPETRAVLEATETVRSAAMGDPKPPNLGGWWSLARRTGMRVKMDPVVH